MITTINSFINGQHCSMYWERREREREREREGRERERAERKEKWLKMYKM